MTETSVRLAPVPADQWDESSRAMLRGHLRTAEKYLSGEPDAPRLPNVLGILGHQLSLGSAWLHYNGVLLQDVSLEPRLRELLILRVAWQTHSRYEWVQHARIGQQVGLTYPQVEAVTRGSDDPVWTPVERLLLDATDQLLDVHRVEDATWSGLQGELDSGQLLEVLFIVGSYLCLALVFNSVGLELDAEMDPGAAPDLPETRG
ncbi:carboxymuconolactone decarboxylase family protein [Blastococcus sp. URHD0036]|uniref:carboxymuconolactone decarboxylase family protein n=1 Tax=Blastococcus sp. URHD0036 TaxID=1380356 RepID=UPI0004972FD3|nr:carboxymuconolactone decarboxylase family protein [Blastococcus sp. URHD0036]